MLARRLAAATAVVVAATSVVIAVVADHASRASLLPTQRARLQEYVSSSATALTASTAALREDALFVARATRSPDLVAAVCEGRPLPDAERVRVRAVLDALVRSKPQYLQARLIGRADGGRELVRFERELAGGPIREVGDEALQRKGDRPYFVSALRTAADSVDVSPFELNQEHGRVQIPHVPVIRASAPLVDAAGRACGAFVINLDMRETLDALRSSSAGFYALHIVRTDGTFVLHPDRSREFEPTARWSDEHPELASLAASAVPVQRDAHSARSEPILAASVPSTAAGGPPLSVIAVRPLPRGGVRGSLVAATLAAMLLGAGAAFVLGRRISRPINEITRATAALVAGGGGALPVSARGELGVLARSVEKLRVDLREREAALRLQEARFRGVFESAPVALLLLDSDGRPRLVNRSAERLLRRSAEELRGAALESVLPALAGALAPDAPASRERLDRVPGAVAGARWDLELVRPDGTAVSVDLAVDRLADAAGGHLLVSLVDISERKRAQAFLERVVAAVPHATIVTDASGRVALANDAACALLGYTAEELRGLPVGDLVPEDARDRHDALAAAFLSRRAPRPMGKGNDLVARRKDGTHVPVEIGLAPVAGLDGTVIVASLVNLTERLRQKEELTRSNAELEHFAYIASHDLQEPLRLVTNYVELLGERYRGRLDDTADKYIRLASDGARRMQRLIGDLLSFARVTSTETRLAPVDTAAVLDGVLASLRVLLDEAGAVVERGPLPVVAGEPTLLHQLFQNLLANAVKFRSAAPPRIEVSAVAEAGLWHFTVADNGIGLDMAYATRIFDMFERLNSRARFDGSGLGLAICKRIVERHGGRIWVESRPDEGARFHFTLPAAGASGP